MVWEVFGGYTTAKTNGGGACRLRGSVIISFDEDISL